MHKLKFELFLILRTVLSEQLHHFKPFCVRNFIREDINEELRHNYFFRW